MPKSLLIVNPEAITAIREGQGLSVPQLATAAGVDRSQLHRIETGECRPYPQTLKKIADALGVPVTALKKPRVEDAA